VSLVDAEPTAVEDVHDDAAIASLAAAAITEIQHRFDDAIAHVASLAHVWAAPQVPAAADEQSVDEQVTSVGEPAPQFAGKSTNQIPVIAAA
jgi:hypothetical protein